MKNTILGLGAVASAAAVMALFGTATAAADYEGETYADASDAMSADGVDPIVATRVGDKLDEDDCIVTSAWSAPFMRDDGGEFAHADSQMLVSLNCAGSYATAKNPGASVASPMGREAKSKADEEAAQEEQKSLAAVSEPGA